MGRIKGLRLVVALVAMLFPVSRLPAGDIVGTVGVPKPDHAFRPNGFVTGVDFVF